MAINSSSFSPWEPVLNSGKGKEKTFRVLLQGRYTWFLVAVAEMREVPAAWRIVGRMGVKKCSTTEVPDAPQPFAPKVLSLPPPLMQWSIILCVYPWIPKVSGESQVTLVLFSAKLIFTAYLFIIPNARTSFLLGPLAYCGFFHYKRQVRWQCLWFDISCKVCLISEVFSWKTSWNLEPNSVETSAVAIQPLHPGLKGGDCKVAIPYNKGWLEVKLK